MAHELHLSPTVVLPLDAITQTFGLLGRKGSGKTYGAGKLVEELLGAGGQTVVLDPVGNWYGLRLDAEGKPDGGIPIPVLGGEHGDLAIDPTAGALIADLVVDRGISAVVDVSSLRKKKRKGFVADFAEQLFHRKKTARTAMHLVLEEAQVFAPQRPGNGEERMVGAVEDIIRLGRNYGIGATLISQRPQSVNKEILNQVECLFVFQVAGAHERKAIRDWVVHQGIDVSEMTDALPSLPVGTCYFWSPQWLGRLEQVTIGRKRTYDSSSTPEVGVELCEPRQLAPVELDDLRKSMAWVVEKSTSLEPDIVRRHVDQLTGEVGAGKAERVEPEYVEVPVLSPESRRLLREARDGIEFANASIASIVDSYDEMADKFYRLTLGLNDRVATELPEAESSDQGTEESVNSATSSSRGSGRARQNEHPSLRKGAREMLQALAQFPDSGLTRRQLATLSGLSPASGTFSTYLSDLRRSRLLVDERGTLVITREGLALLGDAVPTAPVTTDQLVRLWTQRFRRGARTMLRELVAHYPAAVSRSALAQIAGLKHSGGTFSTYLSDLRRNGLVTEPEPGLVRASEALFLGRGK